MECAIAQAACDTLDALFPSQKPAFDQQLANDLGQVPNSPPKADGISLGHRAASAILALRANDGSQQAEPRVGIDFITTKDPGKWQQDPIIRNPLALAQHWGSVQPLVLQTSNQFRLP